MSSRDTPVTRSTFARSNSRIMEFRNSWMFSARSFRNSLSSSDSSHIARIMPPTRTGSLPILGLSQILACRASSVSRWSMSIRDALPSRTAFLIGTARTFCSSVMLEETTRKRFEPSRSHIGLVAAGYPSCSQRGVSVSGRVLEATSTLLVPMTARANFWAT